MCSRSLAISLFFFNDTATTEIYTLSLHDALPISCGAALPLARPLRRDADDRDETHRIPPGELHLRPRDPGEEERAAGGGRLRPAGRRGHTGQACQVAEGPSRAAEEGDRSHLTHAEHRHVAGYRRRRGGFRDSALSPVQGAGGQEKKGVKEQALWTHSAEKKSWSRSSSRSARIKRSGWRRWSRRARSRCLPEGACPWGMWPPCSFAPCCITRWSSRPRWRRRTPMRMTTSRMSQAGGASCSAVPALSISYGTMRARSERQSARTAAHLRLTPALAQPD